MAIAIIASAAVFSASCAQLTKYEKKINAYLTEKYPDKSFTLNSYTQRNDKSGRYEVSATCDDDGTDFIIFVYSASNMTDSYLVSKANAKALETIKAVFPEEVLKYISEIRWLRPYKEDNTDYSFRETENLDSVDISDITSIDTVRFSGVMSSSEAEKKIREVMLVLCYSDVCLTSIGFDFTVGYKSCRFISDTSSICSSEEGEIAKAISDGIDTGGIVEDVLSSGIVFLVEYSNHE